jgi:hypothetical protein
LINEDRPISFEAVKQLTQAEEVAAQASAMRATSVFVEPADLSGFDCLFADMEVWHEPSDGCQDDADGLLAGAAPADVSR